MKGKKKKLKTAEEERQGKNGSAPASTPVEGGEQGSQADDEVAGVDAREDELEQARREAAENYDRFLRARAELDNAIKRHEKHRGEALKYGVEGLARDLLCVVDDLERALEHSGESDSALGEGVELVLKGLRATLTSHGVERIEALGGPFDPSFHQAVATRESDEHGPNIVLEEHRSGYLLHERLLRPALVVVSKAVDSATEGDGDGDVEQKKLKK